jgi:hypothetical protein
MHDPAVLFHINVTPWRNIDRSHGGYLKKFVGSLNPKIFGSYSSALTLKPTLKLRANGVKSFVVPNF